METTLIAKISKSDDVLSIGKQHVTGITELSVAKPQIKKSTETEFIWGKVVHNTVARGIELFGEPFELSVLKNGHLLLTHKKWSIEAEGKNLLEVERNLITECKDVAQHYLKIPAIKLSVEAMRMRDFLLSVI